jgi:hypothetical protein
LKWLPGFRASYMSAIMGQARGQPGWLKPWFDLRVNLQHPGVTFVGYLVAVAETVIAVAVIAGFARKLGYSAAIVFSLLIWGTAEGFGGPYTAGPSGHRHRRHRRGRVRRAAGPELLRRAGPVQRGLLSGAEDQLVVADRPDPAPGLRTGPADLRS